MKIAFMASDAVAIPAIEAVLECPKTGLACIVSNPDKPKGRGGKTTPNDVSAWAISKNIPLLRPEKSPDAEVVETLKKMGVECVVVMAYGKMLREEFLNFAPLGCLNLHGSVLPELRGASPIETAIAIGKTSTGVSLMRVAKKMDAGDVCDVIETPISPRETGESLRKKIALDAARLLSRNFGAIESRALKFAPQDEAAATYSRKILKPDFYLDFSKPADELDRRVRAFGCGIISLGGEIFKIGEAVCEGSQANETPGKISEIGRDFLRIACGKGSLKVLKIQAPCAKMLDAAQFLNGRRLEAGAVCASFENEKLLK
ncbi:MAG: methionyl-tRNA formyltransferase [Opitutales bacterium]|nr:methionyl-tRNA formyltransferase [Opitutales bacterium]